MSVATLDPSKVPTRDCPYCFQETTPKELCWQGIHVGRIEECVLCQIEFFVDLPVGQSQYTPYTIDLKNNVYFGPKSRADSWYAQPLLQSFQRPSRRKISFTIEKQSKITSKNVVVLNTIDYLYGHAVLKLLNAAKHLQDKYEVIVIVQKPLRWLVPEAVSEVWTVDIAFSEAQQYFPAFDLMIKQELKRFKTWVISEALSHPTQFCITDFTGIAIHTASLTTPQITFIWRRDRIWTRFTYLSIFFKKIGVLWPLLYWQILKLHILFFLLKIRLPQVRCVVAGIGKEGKFLPFVTDLRVDHPSTAQEKQLCKVYSESMMVIGVHGSNLLLPSAHSLMTVSLLPTDRYSNIAQDILYQNIDIDDKRMDAVRHLFLPTTTGVIGLSSIVVSLVSSYSRIKQYFTT